MKHLYKSILFLSILWGGITTVIAQPGLSNYDIASKLDAFWPTSVSASQLFRKPAEGIDYATGQATIRIPLYEIRTADFVLPISIYFTTGGIKKHQLSGHIGTGWQLEAEPMISRTVRNHPDEKYFLTDSTSRYARDNKYYLLRLASGQADIDQDIFHYRLLSGPGKFLLGESSHRYFHPIPLTKEGFRITTSSSRLSSDFEEPISITDPSGNLYIFGKDKFSREKSVQGIECVTAWKASEILSPNGDFLRFSYADKIFNEYPFSRYDFYMVEDNYQASFPDVVNVPPHPGYWVGVKGEMNYYYLSGTEMDPFAGRVPVFKQWELQRDVPYATLHGRAQSRPIKRIDFAGGSVRFHYQSATGLLERVEVYSGNSLIRSIRLSTIGVSLPFLDKVEISGSDMGKTECYRFDYLPNRDKISKEQYQNNVGRRDDEGSSESEVAYQNVSITDPTGNPDLTFTIGNGGDNYFSYLRQENLCKVVYPSGGYTEYKYETGWANYPSGNNGGSVWAGPRLASITEHPICGIPVVRTFKYGNNPQLTGGGYARFPVDKSSFSKQYTKHYIRTDGFGNQFAHSGRCRLYCNQNLYTSDETVYYPYVLETVGETSTLRYFQCRTDFTAGVRPDFPAPIGLESLWIREDSCAYYNGDVHTATRWFSYDSQLAMVSEISSHALFEGLSGYPGQMSLDIEHLYKYSYSENTVNVLHAEQGYKSVRTVTYDGRDVCNVTENRTYSTDNPRRLLSIDTGRERIEFSYPAYNRNPTSIYSLMKARNELSTPVESRHYLDGVLRKKLVYQYDPDADTERGYSLSAIKESSDASGQNLRVAEQYDGYLGCGKPTQVTRLDGTTVCFVWGYGGLHPIAVIEGMTTGQVAAAGVDFEGLSTSHTISESVYSLLDGLRASHPEARVSTYRYLPMIGQIRRTSPDGVTIHYDYDSFGRLSTIKDNSLKTTSTYEYHETNP